MAEDKDPEEDLRTVARSRMAHLPAETAGGRLDPAGTAKESEPSEAAEPTDEEPTTSAEDETPDEPMR
jgi:hypothetical protein